MRNSSAQTQAQTHGRPAPSRTIAVCCLRGCRWCRPGTATPNGEQGGQPGIGAIVPEIRPILEPPMAALAGGRGGNAGDAFQESPSGIGQEGEEIAGAGVVQQNAGDSENASEQQPRRERADAHCPCVRAAAGRLSSSRRDAGAVMAEVPRQHDLGHGSAEQHERAASGQRDRPAASVFVPARPRRAARASPGRVGYDLQFPFGIGFLQIFAAGARQVALAELLGLVDRRHVDGEQMLLGIDDR